MKLRQFASIDMVGSTVILAAESVLITMVCTFDASKKLRCAPPREKHLYQSVPIKEEHGMKVDQVETGICKSVLEHIAQHLPSS